MNTEMRIQFERHLSDLKHWLVCQPNMDVLYISYINIFANPKVNSARVYDFIGLSLDVEKMLAIPNQILYRNRAGQG
ncbi:MAG: sulfotransferase domain-containing protein [Chloroflexi bacterium]|nr:sulfotransferase domain-containing protein [Chloroflexota bacterium]